VGDSADNLLDVFAAMALATAGTIPQAICLVRLPASAYTPLSYRFLCKSIAGTNDFYIQSCLTNRTGQQIPSTNQLSRPRCNAFCTPPAVPDAGVRRTESFLLSMGLFHPSRVRS